MKDSDSVNLIGVIDDELNLYDGNLRYYFKVVFEKARNLNNPYHNFRHIFHVTWLCYKALAYYKENNKPIDKNDARALLIAAMFHDFDHK